MLFRSAPRRGAVFHLILLWQNGLNRLCCLLLALTNQVLSALGKPVLPIESQTVEQLVTAGITTVAALVAWWKNNSFTPAALQADQTYDKLKAQGK